MGHQPERTCIGCRGVFAKDQVVRIISGPMGMAIDYREKLPGRAAYVCPRPGCIHKALTKDVLARSLRSKVRQPGADEFIAQLSSVIREKIKSLLLMAARAGKLVVGYSAVRDALEKGRVDMIIYAADLSDGTREKIERTGPKPVLREATLFTRSEWGGMLGRELVGVVGIEDTGFCNAVWNETERLKGLINGT